MLIRDRRVITFDYFYIFAHRVFQTLQNFDIYDYSSFESTFVAFLLFLANDVWICQQFALSVCLFVTGVVSTSSLGKLVIVISAISNALSWNHSKQGSPRCFSYTIALATAIEHRFKQLLNKPYENDRAKLTLKMLPASLTFDKL